MRLPFPSVSLVLSSYLTMQQQHRPPQILLHGDSVISAEGSAITFRDRRTLRVTKKISPSPAALVHLFIAGDSSHTSSVPKSLPPPEALLYAVDASGQVSYTPLPATAAVVPGGTALPSAPVPLLPPRQPPAERSRTPPPTEAPRTAKSAGKGKQRAASQTPLPAEAPRPVDAAASPVPSGSFVLRAGHYYSHATSIRVVVATAQGRLLSIGVRSGIPDRSTPFIEMGRVPLCSSASATSSSSSPLASSLSTSSLRLSVGPGSGLAAIAHAGDRMVTLIDMSAHHGASTPSAKRIDASRCRWTVATPVMVEQVSVSPSARSLAVGGARGEIVVFADLAGAGAHTAAQRCFTEHWHHSPLTALRFTVDGRGLLSGAAEGVLCHWSLDRFEMTKVATGLGPIQVIQVASASAAMPPRSPTYPAGGLDAQVRHLAVVASTSTLALVDLLQQRVLLRREGVLTGSDLTSLGDADDAGRGITSIQPVLWNTFPCLLVNGNRQRVSLYDPVQQMVVHRVAVTEVMEAPRRGAPDARVTHDLWSASCPTGDNLATYEFDAYDLTRPSALRFWRRTTTHAGTVRHQQTQVVYGPHADDHVLGITAVAATSDHHGPTASNATSYGYITGTAREVKCWWPVVGSATLSAMSAAANDSGASSSDDGGDDAAVDTEVKKKVARRAVLWHPAASIRNFPSQQSIACFEVVTVAQRTFVLVARVAIDVFELSSTPTLGTAANGTTPSSFRYCGSLYQPPGSGTCDIRQVAAVASQSKPMELYVAARLRDACVVFVAVVGSSTVSAAVPPLTISSSSAESGATPPPASSAALLLPTVSSVAWLASSRSRPEHPALIFTVGERSADNQRLTKATLFLAELTTTITAAGKKTTLTTSASSMKATLTRRPLSFDLSSCPQNGCAVIATINGVIYVALGDAIQQLSAVLERGIGGAAEASTHSDTGVSGSKPPASTSSVASLLPSGTAHQLAADASGDKVSLAHRLMHDVRTASKFLRAVLDTDTTAVPPAHQLLSPYLDQLLGASF